jgi:hypothetical protein
MREEIERTREQLGETVQALAAKADVKARAQDKAAQVAGRMKTKARHARQQAAVKVGQVQSQLADESAAPWQKMASMSGPANQQVRQQAALAAAKISTITPEPVQRAAHKAAATARQHRVPYRRRSRTVSTCMRSQARMPGLSGTAARWATLAVARDRARRRPGSGGWFPPR